MAGGHQIGLDQWPSVEAGQYPDARMMVSLSDAAEMDRDGLDVCLTFGLNIWRGLAKLARLAALARSQPPVEKTRS